MTGITADPTEVKHRYLEVAITNHTDTNISCKALALYSFTDLT